MKEWVIARNEIKSMLREKSLVLILLVELLLVVLSSLLNVGYVLLTTPESSSELYNLNSFIYVGIVSETPEQYIAALDGVNIPYVIYPDFTSAFTDFQNGLIDVIMIGDLPISYEKAAIDIYLPENSPKVDLVKLGLKTMLLQMEDNLRRQRISAYKPNIKPLEFQLEKENYSKEIEIYYIFTLPLLLFLPSLVGGSLIIDSITEDIETKTILNLLEAPLTNQQIIAGKILAALVITLAQSTLWLIILSKLGLGLENPISLWSVSLLYSLFYVSLGGLTALTLKNLRQSQIIHTVVSLTSISLFSPAANLSPVLISNSPAHILTGLASGASPLTYGYQLLLITVFAIAATAANFGNAKQLDNL